MKRSLAPVYFARMNVLQPLVTKRSRRPWIYQPRARRVTTVPELLHLSSIRAAPASIFARKDIEPVLWADVFGSFAVGRQTSESDVDVVVIHSSDYDDCQLPPDAPLLEDLLPEAWGRKVDVIHIVSGKDFRGYVSIESLLCSQTIYGSVNEPSVTSVRQKAQHIFDSGFSNFKRVLNDIERTRAMLSGVSSQVATSPGNFICLSYQEN